MKEKTHDCIACIEYYSIAISINLFQNETSEIKTIEAGLFNIQSLLKIAENLGAKLNKMFNQGSKLKIILIFPSFEKLSDFKNQIEKVFNKKDA